MLYGEMLLEPWDPRMRYAATETQLLKSYGTDRPYGIAVNYRGSRYVMCFEGCGEPTGGICFEVRQEGTKVRDMDRTDLELALGVLLDNPPKDMFRLPCACEDTRLVDKCVRRARRAFDRFELKGKVRRE